MQATALVALYIGPMESKNLCWLENAKQSLEKYGFLRLPEFEVGERIATFESRGFPYGTVYALEALVEPPLFDPVSKSPTSPISLSNFLRESERF